MADEDSGVALRYMGFPENFLKKKKFAWQKKRAWEKVTWQLVAMAQRSVAKLCIIPAQDYLCLPASARINTPSTLGGNWEWRMEKGAFSDELCEKIARMTKLYGRKYISKESGNTP
jgi:4-alpha-glucanotransferase